MTRIQQPQHHGLNHDNSISAKCTTTRTTSKMLRNRRYVIVCLVLMSAILLYSPMPVVAGYSSSAGSTSDSGYSSSASSSSDSSSSGSSGYSSSSSSDSSSASSGRSSSGSSSSSGRRRHRKSAQKGGRRRRHRKQKKARPQPYAIDPTAYVKNHLATAGDANKRMAYDVAKNADAFFCQCGCVLNTYHFDGKFAKKYTDSQRQPKYGVNVRAIPVTSSKVADDILILTNQVPLQKVVKYDEGGVMNIMEYAALIVVEAPPLMAPEERVDFLNLITEGKYANMRKVYEMTGADSARDYLVKTEAANHVDVASVEPSLYLQQDAKKQKKKWNDYCKVLCYLETFRPPHQARAQTHMEFAVFKRPDDPMRTGRPFSDEALHIANYHFIPPKNEGESIAQNLLKEFQKVKKREAYVMFALFAAEAAKQKAHLESLTGRVKIHKGRSGGSSSSSSSSS
eukprot:Lankesteria_metandrocarpae@DN4678_c0_g1_i6.p1